MLTKRGKISADNVKTGVVLITCPNCNKKVLDSELKESKCPHCNADIVKIDE